MKKERILTLLVASMVLCTSLIALVNGEDMLALYLATATLGVILL